MNKTYPTRSKLCYVLGEFPSRTEHFILHEIRELQSHNLDMVIMVLRKSDFDLPVNLSLPPITYDPGKFSAAKWKALLIWLLKKPMKVSQMFLNDWKSTPFKLTNTLRIIKHLSISAYFANQLSAGLCPHIHAHFANAPARIARFMATLLDTHFSVTAHAQDINVPVSYLVPNLCCAQFVVTCTARSQEVLRKKYFQKAPEKVHHVFHGINLKDWNFTQRIRPSYKIKIISVGRLVQKKGFHILVRALFELKAKKIPFTCKIIGDGPLRNSLMMAADQLDPGQLHFTGFLTQHEVNEQLQWADIFVLPSIHADDGDCDGLPNALVEAMALGLPVVGTRVAAVCGIVIEEETGLLSKEKDHIDLAWQIERLINDEQLFQRLSFGGRIKVENDLNLEASTQQLLKLFPTQIALR